MDTEDGVITTLKPSSRRCGPRASRLQHGARQTMTAMGALPAAAIFSCAATCQSKISLSHRLGGVLPPDE